MRSAEEQACCKLPLISWELFQDLAAEHYRGFHIGTKNTAVGARLLSKSRVRSLQKISLLATRGVHRKV